jgi:hypothetical protein
MAGYGDRTITETFDDLAEGIFVTIKNPALMTEEQLRPKRDVSKIKDRKEQSAASNAWLATFITDWHVLDAEDISDEPAALGEPCAETVAKCPAPITSWIVRKIQAVSDPR